MRTDLPPSPTRRTRSPRLVIALAATLLTGACSAQSLQDLLRLRRDQNPAPAARPRAEPRPASPAALPSLPNAGRPAAAPPAFQPGRYDGPPRWGFDTAFAAKIARLRVFSSGGGREQQVGGDAMRSLALYTLSLQRASTLTFRDVMAQQEVPATLLDCEYRRIQPTATEAGDPAFRPESIKMFFWQAGTRQALSAPMLRPYQSRSDQVADVERDACPADFASALTAGFGESGWLAPTQTALAARHDEVRENIDTGIWHAADHSRWADAPQVLAPAEERALAQEIDKVLAGLEARGKVPDAKAYYTALNRQLEPAMARLAASGVARAQHIPKGEAGRAAFEQWDGGIGVTVMRLTMRVHRWGQPGKLFTGVLGRYMNLYAGQFGDKGALDRRYHAQMLKDIAQYKVEQARRAADDPSVESTSTHGVWVLRPRESALYRMVSSGVQIVSAYGKARAEIERYLDTMEREIPQARQAFWICYEQRCPDGGRLYLAFSTLINDLDRFLIQRTAWEGAVGRAYADGRHGSTFLQLMGMDRNVNTHLTGACDAAYDRFLGRFVTWMSLDAAAMRRQLDDALAGDGYLNVQQCRDRMEFILRPRAQKSGLL
ncbi:MAG: hypothetical protein QM788_04540 [Roseateles sp.]|uniref:hypothetical protein n=1 Tax=Roseateles sp. TaxID=1971397 RepID=UPI0039EB2EE2